MNAVQRLREATGLDLSRETVERALRMHAAATGRHAGAAEETADVDADVDAADLAALVELVVVPESWLFRDRQAFAVAAAYARRRLERGERQLLRMLSIPCAGGEEPYSLAMALVDAGVPPATFAIDGVDLSTGCIARAEQGAYGRNAFRAKDLDFRDRHFVRDDDDEDLYRIDPALRRRVRFRQGNLLTSELAPPGSYDVIFCRNLLIYFDGPTTTAAIARLDTLLADEGMLLAGYAEVPSFARNGFTPLPYRQAFALRKTRAPEDGPYAGLPLPGDAIAPVRAAAAIAVQPERRARPRPAPVPPRTERRATPRPVPTPAPAPEPAPESSLDEARRLADQGRQGDAEAICRALLARQPDNAEAWFLLGVLAGDTAPEDAEAALRRCLYLAPDHYDALCHLALLAGRRGDAGAQAGLQARAARVWRRRHSDRAGS